MIETEMLTAERLREILAAIPGVERVVVDEDEGRLVARVVASRWEGVEDWQRQEEIYGVLLDALTQRHERRRVEFVFTDSPTEYAAFLAGEA